MHACYSHVENGSDPKRAGHAAPQAQGPGCERRTDTLGLSADRTRTSGRAAYPRGNAHQTARSKQGDVEDTGRSGRSRGARIRVIVIDASAVLEFLLQTRLGARIEARLFRNEDEFHSPHLVDVEVAQGL